MADEKKCILYIEDELYNRILLKKLLEPKGFDVDEAEDGLSGLEKLREKRYDLILLDINMEGMNGYEIATRIKSMDECKDIPLVALTANVLQKSKERALISGCDGFLTKPIDGARFPVMISQYMNGKKEFIEPDKIHELMKEHNVELVNHLEKEIRELQRINQELKEVDKIKSDFISIASHELRTPLVTIVGYVGLLLSNRLGQLSDEHLKVLKVVDRNSKRLDRIVKDLLTLSRLEKNVFNLRIARCSVKKIVSALLEDYKLVLEERELTHQLRCEGEIPGIECDEERITQVVSNVVNNAIKFTKNGGSIDVEVAFPSQHISKKFDLDPQQYLDIIVSDTGIGIPEDKLEKVFDKFTELIEVEKHHSSETEFMGGGVGIGLPLSRGIVQHHNGYIWAEQAEENGTRIIIILPLKHVKKQMASEPDGSFL